MSESKLRTQSMDFSVSIINLVRYLKEKRESIIANQIGISGTSSGVYLMRYETAISSFQFDSSKTLLTEAHKFLMQM